MESATLSVRYTSALFDNSILHVQLLYILALALLSDFYRVYIYHLLCIYTYTRLPHTISAVWRMGEEEKAAGVLPAV